MKKTTAPGAGEDLKPLRLSVTAGGSVGGKTALGNHLITPGTAERLAFHMT